MIIGIDTTGQIYLSLLQSNSNDKIMEIFFKALVNKLDKERNGWRSDTLIILDNAPYHSCGSSLKLFEEMNIPLCFTGPHSYDASPSELCFAHFKKESIPTGFLSTKGKYLSLKCHYILISIAISKMLCNW